MFGIGPKIDRAGHDKPDPRWRVEKQGCSETQRGGHFAGWQTHWLNLDGCHDHGAEAVAEATPIQA